MESSGKELRHPYEKSPYLLLQEVARVILREPLPPEVGNHWRTFRKSVYAIDNAIDSQKNPSDRGELMFRIAEYLQSGSSSFVFEPTLLVALNELSQSISALSSEDQKRFFENAQSIFDLTEKMKTTTDVDEFIKLRRKEGALTANFLLLFIPPSLRKGDQYQKLEKIFQHLGSAGNTMDSLADLESDFAQGEVSIEPNTTTRLKLLRACAIDTAVVLSTAPLASPKLLATLWRVPRQFIATILSKK